MKRKRFPKKLVLNKKTVSNLNPLAMIGVRGGQETGNPFICETVIDCPHEASLSGCISCYTDGPCYTLYCSSPYTCGDCTLNPGVGTCSC